MDKVQDHRHDGTSARKNRGSDLENAPQAVVTPAPGGAGAVYDATVQGIINSQAATINSLITKLKTLGLLQ